MNLVAAACDVNPSCVGYYTNDINPTTWSIATKTDPSKCTDWRGNAGDYPVYKSKVSGYSNSGNTEKNLDVHTPPLDYQHLIRMKMLLRQRVILTLRVLDIIQVQIMVGLLRQKQIIPNVMKK